MPLQVFQFATKERLSLLQEPSCVRPCVVGTIPHNTFMSDQRVIRPNDA